MRKKKRILIAATVVSVAVFASVAALMLGLFVYPYSMSKLTEVPQYDLLETQYAQEQAILNDYSQGRYTIDAPYIVVDPYGLNPLSALILFETDRAHDVEVTIQGDDVYSTYTYIHRAEAAHAEIPIIGLYPGRENIVTLTMDGIPHKQQITTEPLPVDFQDYVLEVSKPEKMAAGITLFTAINESYSALLDNHAQVRGYLANKRIAHGTSMIILRNGNILSTGDEYKQIPYNMATLYEYNWLGKIFRIYDIPNAVHHSLSELPNGDILAVSNHEDMFQTGTREDVVIIIDRATGEVKKSYDYRTIVDETREPYHHFHPNILNVPNQDWMHCNSASYDEARNAVIASSPTQSMVISIDADTAEINWILGPHDGYSDELSQYLLTPIGDGFEWQWCQHDPTLLTNDDPNLIDILIFDNGQAKSFDEETAVDAKDNYSRAVIFRINLHDRTVEQLWQYGKERGSECYSTYLGSARMTDGNVLIDFGGQLRKEGVPVDDLTESILGDLVTRSRVVEVTMEGEVVYEVSVHENAFTRAAGTYQSSRIPLFMANSFQTRLGEVKGERVGASYLCGPPAGEFADFSIPPIYTGKLSATFTVIHREQDRLILDGTLLDNGITRLLSKAFVIFRGKNSAHQYEANSGLHGRFFLSVDLNELPPGEYQIAVAGATLEGNDALGRRSMGHFPTEYKVKVD